MGDTENIKDNLGEEEAAEKDTETTADEKAETAGKSSSDDDEADAAAEYNDTASEYADMEEALAEANDKYVRLFAEYDNYRKRTAKEKAETYQNASAKCIEELLPVIDSFERSLEAECADGNFKNGMQMIFNQISGFLMVIVALCEEFDPNFHNAFQQLDGTDYASNHVCQVFQKGYMLGDKLIRPAMVAVAL